MTPDDTLKPERWYEVYDWCRDIQKLAQKVSERVDDFANTIPDPPKFGLAAAPRHSGAEEKVYLTCPKCNEPVQITIVRPPHTDPPVGKD